MELDVNVKKNHLVLLVFSREWRLSPYLCTMYGISLINWRNDTHDSMTKSILMSFLVKYRSFEQENNVCLSHFWEKNYQHSYGTQTQRKPLIFEGYKKCQLPHLV